MVKDTSSNKESLHILLQDISHYETSFGIMTFVIFAVDKSHAILNISIKNDIKISVSITLFNYLYFVIYLS